VHISYSPIPSSATKRCTIPPLTRLDEIPHNRFIQSLAWREGGLRSHVMSSRPADTSHSLFRLILRLTIHVFNHLSSITAPPDPSNEALNRSTSKANSCYEGLEAASGPEQRGCFYLLLRFRLLEFPRKYYFCPHRFVIRQRFCEFNDGTVGSLGARGSVIQKMIDDPMFLLRV
jgi:hypothetical protein